MIDFNKGLLITCLTILCVLAIVTISSRNLVKSTIYFSIFSLLMALTYLLMNAPDVAITEAAIGGGITTLIFLATILQVGRVENFHKKNTHSFLLMALLLMFLIFSTTGFPKFGDINSIANQTLSEYYMSATKEMMEIPNVVTAILASFRGFDTMGEVIVIFIAGISVYLILARDEEPN